MWIQSWCNDVERSFAQNDHLLLRGLISASDLTKSSILSTSCRRGLYVSSLREPDLECQKWSPHFPESTEYFSLCEFALVPLSITEINKSSWKKILTWNESYVEKRNFVCRSSSSRFTDSIGHVEPAPKVNRCTFFSMSGGWPWSCGRSMAVCPRSCSRNLCSRSRMSYISMDTDCN